MYPNLCFIGLMNTKNPGDTGVAWFYWRDPSQKINVVSMDSNGKQIIMKNNLRDCPPF